LDFNTPAARARTVAPAGVEALPRPIRATRPAGENRAPVGWGPHLN